MKKYAHLVFLLLISFRSFSQSLTDSLSHTKEIEGIVIQAQKKDIKKSSSPIPVDIINTKLFKKNPTPSLLDALGMVNGVMPHLDCSVCNTGDIHINGMDGSYTLILIDGMPIVSGLSTVYGLSGIPLSMIENIEITKGPGEARYGTEAMGGIINIITKNPQEAPKLSIDVMSTSWGEINTDIGSRLKLGNKINGLLGVNYFLYDNPIDHNHDNFTDAALQNRISIFNKWNLKRDENRVANLALRWVNEDRWGGEMNWKKKYRGSDEVYGESIYTKRVELIGMYQLPFTENIFTQFSYNWHDQNSWYGDTPFMATQQIAFAQIYWNKKIKGNNLLTGFSYRYTYYDDNTPATSSADGLKNKPSKKPFPGFFVQDLWEINNKNSILAGYRYDHDKDHGNIYSPRIAYKFSPNSTNALRASFGTGFRVVNIFTEDHAALTGGREVVFEGKLNPEKSYNGNLNYTLKIPTENLSVNLDITGFYSYFTNKIIGDFDSDPTKIIYKNLDGHAISQGISINTDWVFDFPLKMMLGATYMDVFSKEDQNKTKELHAPNWLGTFALTYKFPKNFTLDLTGNWTGPMRLPIEPNDFRKEYSPWFCIMNIQATQKLNNGFEIYAGLKNILNFIPSNPIMRPFDPFDKDVNDPINNPNGYTFDTSYNYASLQGIRGFLGIRYTL